MVEVWAELLAEQYVLPAFPDEADDADRPLEEATSQLLSETTFCVIDLETTGTSNESRITEIGAVKVRGGEVVGEFHTLINPGVPIPGFITAMTGISNASVARAPRLRAVFGSLLEFCRDCVMVAHNARFDMGFLTRAASNLGYAWESTVVIDTVNLARRVIPRHEVVNYRLGTLADYFHTAVDPTHRALDDARATVDVLHGLIGRVGNQGVRTLEDLLQFTHTITKARRVKKTWADDLPEGPGVYFFVRDDDSQTRKVLYVGTSKHLRRRVATYFTASETRRRMEEMVGLATGVEAVECQTALEAAIVELRLIRAHQPPYNRRGKQPHHCWIKVTSEPIPRFSIVRQLTGTPARPAPAQGGPSQGGQLNRDQLNRDQLNRDQSQGDPSQGGQSHSDPVGYCGPFPSRAPAEAAMAALTEAFALRTCKDRLSLALRDLDAYRQRVAQAVACLAGDIRQVHATSQAAMTALSAQLRFEEASEVHQRLRLVEYGLRRHARLSAVAACPQIVAARRVDRAWEIHIFRHAQLAGAAVARPGDDPLRVAEAALATAKTVHPPFPGAPGGSIEEAELVAAWLEQPGVRLLDVEGVWGWPVHTQVGRG